MAVTLIENITLVTPDAVQENYGILIEDQKISSIFPMAQRPVLPQASVLDGQGAHALPGLIDLHIHGFAGHGPELGTPEELWAMSNELARYGVSAFCPTLYCAKPQAMKQVLARLAPAVGQETGATILGFHLEGPFISPQKPGVMKPQDIAPADVKLFAEIYEAADGNIAAVTLAPELENIGPVIDFCLQHNILPQAGHTNATYEEFINAVRCGVTHATHAFNAMSPFTQRAPGAAGAVLMCPEVSCEVIADGVHVHPKIISFLHKVKPSDRLVLVTDALRPTQQAAGPFIANGEEVVFENGVWKRATDRVIAGSALTMIQGIKNLIDFGLPLHQAVACATCNPAKRLGLQDRGILRPGLRADILLLRPDFVPLATFIAGKPVV